MPYKITSMEFSVMSPDSTKNNAFVRIVNPELYDADGYPVEGGVMDPRLGVIDPGLYCRTCNASIGDCPGHFGYLELAKPVIHVMYVKVVYELLKITCRKCGRITVEKGSLSSSNTPPSKCPHCKAPQKKIKFAKPYTFYEDIEELDPQVIRERFEKIPASDLKKVKFVGGRPEWLIVTLFPIPPVTMRPSITLETGERSEDDLTHKLVDIVRINQSLKENIDIGAPEFIIRDLWELLQYHVSTYFDNELTGAPLARHRSGRPLKGIIQRLKAKEGRLRGNLLGKRVNFSARTVIVPDPRISINEVGVPETIARELTIPIFVTKQNMSYVKDLIKDNKINYITRPDQRRIKMTEDNKKDVIKLIGTGWSVDRQLTDGDIVLFNRQPSLHRISIMAHRVRVMNEMAFRLNPSVCFPYNADFDGDEMNLHALQNEEARTEAKMLMSVEKNIISPKFGGPVIGLDLDQISGVFMLTEKDVAMSREDAVQLLAYAGMDIDVPEKAGYTGKDVFSLLLPKNMNMTYENNYAKSLDTQEEKAAADSIVVVKNGVLQAGRIDKIGVGAEKGRVINRILKLTDCDFTKDFIDNAGRLGIAYLMRRGFSIGISDLDIPDSVHTEIDRKLDSAKKNVDQLIVSYGKDEIDILPGMTKDESLETQVMKVLSKGVSDMSQIVAQHIKHSDIMNMARAGSKGSLVNLSQMVAGVGQETVLGKRIERGYTFRTLPHVRPHDLSPESKGFVSHGFKQGLTPFEIFWDIMNGREGLMDKSLRTRKSGYMQRRLVNALQDLQVLKDLTVRNSVNDIIQFKAGEDGIDVTKSDFGKFDWRAVLE
ncbi:MAG: DNA-directed RNA polymerase subunit A' [Candidatus Aenigmatarchaeota archaeon]